MKDRPGPGSAAPGRRTPEKEQARQDNWPAKAQARSRGSAAEERRKKTSRGSISIKQEVKKDEAPWI